MLVNIIIIAVITAIVNGIRYALWKDEVPENIAKNRWAIAIVCTIILLFIGVAIQHGYYESTQPGGYVIYAILPYIVAEALKNPDKPKSNE